MKRTVMTLAAIMLAAGVASAFALAPSSQSTHALAQPLAAEAKPLVASEPVATNGKATLAARQAPVPILLKPRPAVEVPKSVEVARAEEPKPQPETPKAGDDPAGGAGAKAAIEADGYKAAKVLRRGDNGLWYAEALRGKTKVMLTVDAQGNVAAE
jgi:hypothetical protein